MHQAILFELICLEFFLADKGYFPLEVPTTIPFQVGEPFEFNWSNQLAIKYKNGTARSEPEYGKDELKQY